MKFAKEAWPFVVPFLLVGGILLASRRPGWASAAFAVGLLVLLFFRDPARRFSGDAAIAIAPADGKVTAIGLVEDPEIGPGRWLRIVTFLSVFDVHVQSCPVAGTVVYSQLRRGLKLAAYKPDVGEKNEGHTQVLLRADGTRIAVRQLAGLIARRVVSRLEVGATVRRGDPLGVIKFGSRVDLFVPENWTALVAVGDRVRNGETPMARPPADGQ